MLYPNGRLLYAVDNQSYHTPAGSGACSALSVLWIGAMHARPTLAMAGVDALGSKEYIERVQHLYETSVHDDDVKAIIEPNGLRLIGNRRTFPLRTADMRTMLEYMLANLGTYYLTLFDNSDLPSHNMAVYTGTHGYLLFDPNYGLYKADGVLEFAAKNSEFLAGYYGDIYDQVEWFACVPAR